MIFLVGERTQIFFVLEAITTIKLLEFQYDFKAVICFYPDRYLIRKFELSPQLRYLIDHVILFDI